MSASQIKWNPFYILSHHNTDMRLKFLTLLMIFVVSVTIALAMNRFGFGVLEDNFVASLNTTYKSSAQFMCFYGLLNFYLYTMAYVYSPSGRPVHGIYIHMNRKRPCRLFHSVLEIIYILGLCILQRQQ